EFEIGRLDVIDPDLLSPQTKKIIDDSGLRSTLLLKTLLPALHWLNHDVQAGRAVFQVNSGVLRLLEQAIQPATFLNKYKVQADGRPVEWIIDCDRAMLLT